MAKRLKTTIEHRFYELPHDFPVLFLDGERWHISDVKSNRLHFHNCLEIGICHSESGTIIFDGEDFHFNAGDITCIPRHIPHTTYSSPNTESLWSYIFVDFMTLFSDMFHSPDSQRYAMTLLKHKNIMNKKDYPKIHFLVSCAIDELRAKKPDYQIVLKGLLLTLYYELLRIQDETSVGKSGHEEISSVANDMLRISPAINYIHDNYMHNFSIDCLARLCHISVTHFRRVFQSIMGMSPLNYLNAVRTEKACILLRSTDQSVISISEQVGFRSISSFNRNFTRLTGLSPREYRSPSKSSSDRAEKIAIVQYNGWI